MQPGLEFIRSQGGRPTCWLPLTTAHRQGRRPQLRQPPERAYTDDVLAFMEQVAAMVAIAVDNGINYDRAQRYQRELREERDRLRFLLDVNNLLVSHLDYPGCSRRSLRPSSGSSKHDQSASRCTIRSRAQLRLDWIYDAARGFTRSDITLPLDRSVAGMTFSGASPACSGGRTWKERGWDGASLMKASGVESVCCVPLVTRNGKLGALYVGSADGGCVLRGRRHAPRADVGADRDRRRERPRLRARSPKLNAQLIDEKQYLERELQHEFTEIIGRAALCAGC